MKNLTMLTASLALCAGASFAAADTVHWNADREANFRMCRTLSATDRWEVNHCLGELPGSFEDLYYRAMNRASDSNGANWNNGTVVVMVPGTTYGSENQTINGESLYAMSYMDRCKKDISDWDAYQMLLKSPNYAERGIIESTWPTLTDTCQHAILMLIKRSQFITPLTDGEMIYWK